MEDGEGLEPGVGGVRPDAVEAVRELSGPSFYNLKDTFDGMQSSVGDVSTSRVVSVERGMKPRAAADEEAGIVDLMFLSEFVEKRTSGDGGTRRR